MESKIAPITTRYFITGSRRKIVLEHDEEYCAPGPGIAAAPPEVCQQMDADAADLDLNAAYYLEQTDHATNSTARMITGPDQLVWLQFRKNTCAVGPDPLRCRIRLTHERMHVVIKQHSAPPPPRK